MTRYPLLFLIGLIAVGLCIGRVFIAGDGDFMFLIGNIVLAAIPLLLEPLFSIVKSRNVPSRFIGSLLALGIAGLWMLFLPNTFYVLTDFMHLNSGVAVNVRGDMYQFGSMSYARGSALYIYDSLMLFMAAAFSAYAGGLALFHAFDWARRKTSVALATPFLGGIMILSAVGVYVGRFGRWNSWDALRHPWIIASDLVQSLADATTYERFKLLVVTMLIFETICFGLVYYAQKHSLPARSAK